MHEERLHAAVLPHVFRRPGLPGLQRAGTRRRLRFWMCYVVHGPHGAGTVRRALGLPLGFRHMLDLRLYRARLSGALHHVRGRRKGIVCGHTGLPDRDAILRGAGLRRLLHGELLRGLRAADRVRALSHRPSYSTPKISSRSSPPGARTVTRPGRQLGARGEHGRAAPRRRRGPRPGFASSTRAAEVTFEGRGPSVPR